MCTAPAWRKLAKAIFHVYVATSRESSFCAFLQRKTFSLAQLGSAGLLSKVPVFHHVCSAYSQTQTPRCNIRMEVKEGSMYIVDIAFVRAVVVIYPGTHWFAKAKHVVAKAKVQKSTLMCVRENSRKLIWNISLAKATLHAAKASRKLVRRFSIRPNKLYGVKTTTYLSSREIWTSAISKRSKSCSPFVAFYVYRMSGSLWYHVPTNEGANKHFNTSWDKTIIQDLHPLAPFDQLPDTPLWTLWSICRSLHWQVMVLLTRPHLKVSDVLALAMANCNQIEKRTSLNVFRFRLHQRAANKIEDASRSGKFAFGWDLCVKLSVAKVAFGRWKTVEIWQVPPLASHGSFDSSSLKFSDVIAPTILKKRTSLNVFRFRLHQRASNKIEGALRSGKFAFGWDHCVKLSVAKGDFEKPSIRLRMLEQLLGTPPCLTSWKTKKSWRWRIVYTRPT